VNVRSNPPRVSCEHCCLARLCLPVGLEHTQLKHLDRIIKRRRPFGRGEHIYEVGTNFRLLYAVRSGTIKTCVSTSNGEERILGFHLPGDLLGLDALGNGHHGCRAVALETSSLCELPFDRLKRLCVASVELRDQVDRLIGNAFDHMRDMLLLLGQHSAEQRLASFLIGLSTRLERRGLSGREFVLSMSRDEIGNYLGLALATVSRLLTRLHEEGVLSVRRRQICIRDPIHLRALGESFLDTQWAV